MSNGEVYQSASGYGFSGYQSTTSFSPSAVDLEGIAGYAGIGKDELASGVFDNARCYLFATSWVNPIVDYEPIAQSILGKTTLEDDKYKIEEMSLIDAINQSIGRTYTPTCYKKFGGQEFAGCKVDLAPITVTGAVTATATNNVFTDSTRTESVNYFKEGTIKFTSGPNAPLIPLEIKSFGTGVIETYEPFYYPITVGDTYTMIPGCQKRLQDCKAWNNVSRFGGFSFVPTTSQYVTRGEK